MDTPLQISLSRFGARSDLRARGGAAWYGVMAVTVVMLSFTAAQARQPVSRGTAAADDPAVCLTYHNITKLILPFTNTGRFGAEVEYPPQDCFTGDRLRSGEFPRDSRALHLYKGAVWVGGVKNGDTLVSAGNDVIFNGYELYPDIAPFGDIHRSNRLDPYSDDFGDAVSEQDMVAVYTDTFTHGVPLAFDQIAGRPHEPLDIEVTQRSYAWSYDYTADMVLMNLEVRNIGEATLQDVYVGIYVDADVMLDQISIYAQDQFAIKPVNPANADDIAGFLFDYVREIGGGCTVLDTLQFAWAADNEGDGVGSGPLPLPNAMGVRLLRPPFEGEQLSFNWWEHSFTGDFDYGPQSRAAYRYMGDGSGAPLGDINKYAMMSNGEVDYDVVYTASIAIDDAYWRPNDYWESRFISTGNDIAYVLSIGPYRLLPGAIVDIPIGFFGGENLHTDRRNFFYIDYWYRPDIFYSNLDFSDLIRNARWTSWIYDNPGVDTDGDGYAGRFWQCVIDSVRGGGGWIPTLAETTYYSGDGVPDWRAESPPDAPLVRVEPMLNGLRVLFNGERSENSRDIFTSINDFEGYRVYMARDAREDSYYLVGTYDREDFDKYVWKPQQRGEGKFELTGVPMTLEELRCLYGEGDDPCSDSSFVPTLFTPTAPYQHPDYPDSIFYFSPHEANVSQFGETTPIRKVYPDQPPPSPAPDESEYTEDGFLKYYEYEVLIDGLLPTVPYWVNVTAFDFGSPATGIKPLETNRTIGAKSAYPASDANQLSGEKPDVYIYPNPYFANSSYRKKGYEGRDQPDRPNNRVRTINFENLPARCTIYIYSLDGDLIRRIDHDVDPADPKHTHDSWDVITRNTQEPVSGLYYWVVESESGETQMGKLMIIM